MKGTGGRGGEAGGVVSRLEHVRAEFPGEPPSVRQARVLVRDALRRWHLADLEETAVSLVSELATNALLHAGTGFAIEITRSSRTVRIAVLDSSATQPNRRHHSPQATTGRGLAMIASMSQAWGSDRTAEPWAKCVWCELPISPDRPEATASAAR